MLEDLHCEGCDNLNPCRYSYTDHTMLEHFFCSIACMQFWLARLRTVRGLS